MQRGRKNSPGKDSGKESDGSNNDSGRRVGRSQNPNRTSTSGSPMFPTPPMMPGSQLPFTPPTSNPRNGGPNFNQFNLDQSGERALHFGGGHFLHFNNNYNLPRPHNEEPVVPGPRFLEHMFNVDNAVGRKKLKKSLTEEFKASMMKKRIIKARLTKLEDAIITAKIRQLNKDPDAFSLWISGQPSLQFRGTSRRGR